MSCYGPAMKQLVAAADALAKDAHLAQVDKNGAPYIAHPRAVACAVSFLGEEAEAIALLHDVIEDTPLSADDLLAAGIPDTVVGAVSALSRPKEGAMTYQDWISALVDAAAASPAVILDGERVPLTIAVKLADNGHNSAPGRATSERPRSLARRYERARKTLIPALPAEVSKRILGVFA